LQKELVQKWDELAPTIGEEEVQAAFRKHREMYQQYMDARYEKVYKPAMAGDKEAAAQANKEGCTPLFDANMKALNEAIEAKARIAKAKFEESQQLYSSSQTTMIGIVVGGMVLGLLIGWGISRLITKPLHATVGVLEAVTKGDLTQKVEYSS